DPDAVARLRTMSPLLSRLLADKRLSPEAQRARRLRDAAYTLVMITERRVRAAAAYWYGGSDELKEYAPFPVSAASGAADEEDVAPEHDAAGDEAAEAAEAEGEPIAGPA